jgi:hypothetical protein
MKQSRFADAQIIDFLKQAARACPSRNFAGPLAFITDNAMVESFNVRLRQECLNEHWFMSLQDARNKIDAWRGFYNEERPHRALD